MQVGNKGRIDIVDLLIIVSLASIFIVIGMAVRDVYIHRNDTSACVSVWLVQKCIYGEITIENGCAVNENGDTICGDFIYKKRKGIL